MIRHFCFVLYYVYIFLRCIISFVSLSLSFVSSRFRNEGVGHCLLRSLIYIMTGKKEWPAQGSLSILFFSTCKLVNARATGGRVSPATADVVPGCVQQHWSYYSE